MHSARRCCCPILGNAAGYLIKLDRPGDVGTGGAAGLWNTYFRSSSRPPGRLRKKVALPLPDKPSIAVLRSEYDGRPEAGSISGTGSRSRSSPPCRKSRRCSHLPELDVFLQRQAVKVPAGGRGARGPVRAGGKRTEIPATGSGSTSSLIDAIPGQHVWAESYDRDLKDIFTLQDEVIQKITSAMSVNLTGRRAARAWAEARRASKPT